MSDDPDDRPFPPPFHGEMTLREARALLRELVLGGGEHDCPCCSQLAKIYARSIYGSVAADLIRVAHAGGMDAREYVKPIELVRQRAPDLVKTRYWGLVEKLEGERDDGSRRVGFWRLTPSGLAFVRRQLAVPKHARVYDNKCLGLTGDPVTIVDCLGKRFDYAELMGWTL